MGEASFQNKMSNNNDVYFQCAREHSSARKLNGSILQLSSQEDEFRSVDGLEEKGLIPPGKDWQGHYLEFMEKADTFYSSARDHRSVGYNDADNFQKEVYKIKEMLTGLNHYADNRIIHYIDEITSICIIQS